jgi:hypothetical protein
MKKITGYKVTDANMKCRGFQFELNKVYNQSGTITPCKNGFHYCLVPADCFDYYTFDPKNRVFEIIDHGDTKTDGNKSCTSSIELVRELTWLEVLTIVNTGKDNTGLKNSGYRNSGYRNSGDWNSGDSNSGDSNSGDSNSGYRNSGDWNSGDSNSGDRNSGDWNSGNRNSGDSNSGYRNSGAFCTDNNPKIRLFDIETNMTVREWESHMAYQIMANYLIPNIWISESEMTPEQKDQYPSYKTTGGFLKSIPMHEAWSNMWHNLTDANKSVFTSLPGFDAEKFKTITGISIK